MRPSAWVEGQARLLTDRALRERFRENAEFVAEELGDGSLALLDLEELERQAALLIAKRRHEAAKRMLKTFAALGADALSLFDGYAQGSWPEGADRHLRDAAGFADFLAARREGRLDRLERARLRMGSRPRVAALILVPSLSSKSGPKLGLHLIFRWRRQIHELRIYAALPLRRSPATGRHS